MSTENTAGKVDEVKGQIVICMLVDIVKYYADIAVAAHKLSIQCRA